MKNILTVACTGGIGSGKTFVSNLFSKIGIPVYYSDIKAKSLYNTSPKLITNLCEILGDDILIDGVLQKQLMASRIFGNKELLERVENVVHPAIVEDYYEWKRQYEELPKNERPPFVIFESAIILEKPKVKSIADKVINVVAPLELRVERIKKRDNLTVEQINARLSSQWDDDKRGALSDFIIFADCKSPVLPQVIKIMEQIKLEKK